MTDDSASAKIFVEFVAMIVRCRIYTLLKDEMLRNNAKSNYMTVPASLRELEKIEMVRMSNGRHFFTMALGEKCSLEPIRPVTCTAPM